METIVIVMSFYSILRKFFAKISYLFDYKVDLL